MSTIKSLSNSDIHLCMDRYIYDDGSQNRETIQFLNQLTKSSNPLFQIKKKYQNVGCHQSYIDALIYLKQLNSYNQNGYSCILDNDVIVNKHFISQLYCIYTQANNQLKSKNIVLSGFNPDNAHYHTIIKKYPRFHLKKTVGGVCFFFSNHLIPIIIDAWEYDQDWGVNKVFNTLPNFYMCSVNKTLVNHIGINGLHSQESKYDKDSEFREEYDGNTYCEFLY